MTSALFTAIGLALNFSWQISDEKSLQESFEFFEDEPALVNFAKTRRAELQKILQSDNK